MACQKSDVEKNDFEVVLVGTGVITKIEREKIKTLFSNFEKEILTILSEVQPNYVELIYNLNEYEIKIVKRKSLLEYLDSYSKRTDVFEKVLLKDLISFIKNYNLSSIKIKRIYA